jgi:hypothetical protein
MNLETDPIGIRQAFDYYNFAEESEPLSSFKFDGKNSLTDWAIDMVTTFHLKVLFTGEYEEGCGLSFSILDSEEMFTLDLRLNDIYCYDKEIFQNTRFNGKWKKSKTENIPDIALVNDMYVRVTKEHFKVTINNVEVDPKVEVDLVRLTKFRGVNFSHRGNCINVDLENSHMIKGK